MAFCGKCGGQMEASAAFCPKCGQANAPGPIVQSSSGAQSGMSENVAGLLCYVFGWITGIIFFLIDKRPFVRFHAAQSMVVFGGLHIINIALGFFFVSGGMMMAGGLGGFGLGAALYSLIGLLGLILWILLMVKAYQGTKYEVPIAGGIAKSIAGK